MTPIEAAFDNIRLIRRKIRIEQDTAERSTGSKRDEAIMRADSLTRDLLRALQDFADMGFEEKVSKLVSEISEKDAFRNFN